MHGLYLCAYKFPARARFYGIFTAASRQTQLTVTLSDQHCGIQIRGSTTVLTRGPLDTKFLNGLRMD